MPWSVVDESSIHCSDMHRCYKIKPFLDAEIAFVQCWGASLVLQASNKRSYLRLLEAARQRGLREPAKHHNENCELFLRLKQSQSVGSYLEVPILNNISICVDLFRLFEPELLEIVPKIYINMSGRFNGYKEIGLAFVKFAGIDSSVVSQGSDASMIDRIPISIHYVAVATSTQSRRPVAPMLDPSLGTASMLPSHIGRESVLRRALGRLGFSGSHRVHSLCKGVLF